MWNLDKFIPSASTSPTTWKHTTSLIRDDNSANPNRGGRSHLPGFMICGRSCEHSLIQYQSEDPRTAPHATERPRAICSCSCIIQEYHHHWWCVCSGVSLFVRSFGLSHSKVSFGAQNRDSRQRFVDLLSFWGGLFFVLVWVSRSLDRSLMFRLKLWICLLQSNAATLVSKHWTLSLSRCVWTQTKARPKISQRQRLCTHNCA